MEHESSYICSIGTLTRWLHVRHFRRPEADGVLLRRALGEYTHADRAPLSSLALTAFAAHAQDSRLQIQVAQPNVGQLRRPDAGAE